MHVNSFSPSLSRMFTSMACLTLTYKTESDQNFQRLVSQSCAEAKSENADGPPDNQTWQTAPQASFTVMRSS